VVCDAPQVQLSMMKKLGADLDPETVNTKICEDMQERPIHFVHDMCHCIKNVRNAWAHLKVIKNANGDNIDWKYIEELVNLQSKEQLHSGNKLTYKHIFFQKSDNES